MTPWRCGSLKPVKYVHMELRRQWVCTVDKDLRTPLHTLAANTANIWREQDGLVLSELDGAEEAAVAAWLVESGCAVDAQDRDGNTALHLLFLHCGSSFCQIGAVPLLLCLLAKGADLCSLRNRGGSAPLDLLLQAAPLHQHPGQGKGQGLTFHEVVKPFLERTALSAPCSRAARYKLRGYSYLSLYVAQQSLPAALRTRLLNGSLSFFLVSHKELVEEAREVLRPAARLSSALLWGSVWHMRMPLENLTADAVLVLEVVADGGASLLWTALELHEAVLDSGPLRLRLQPTEPALALYTTSTSSSTSTAVQAKRVHSVLDRIGERGERGLLVEEGEGEGDWGSLAVDLLIHRRERDLHSLLSLLRLR